MRITAKLYKKILKIVEVVNDHSDEFEMRTQLAEPLLDLVAADHFASFRWDETSQSYGQGVYLNMDANNIQRYSDYYQYRDPITRRLARRRQATLVDQIMPHENLRKTEFFNDFLLNDGLYYGVNLHLYSNEKNIGDLRIWRGRHRDRFDSTTCAVLEILKPHLIQAIHNIQRLKNKNDPKMSIDEQSVYLKHHFTLTNRETQLVGLLLDGERDDHIAEKLSISITTVRTHIKNIFLKTGVNNRCKLQSLVG